MPVNISEDVESRALTLQLLGELFGDDSRLAEIAVRLWDGSLWPDEAPRPVTLTLNHPGALRAMLLPGTETGLVEAYLYDDVDVEGDMEKIFVMGDVLAEQTRRWRKKLSVGRELRRLPGQQNPREPVRRPAGLGSAPYAADLDRDAVAAHYDVPDDFYHLFLDKRLQYSCAYFRTPQDSLDTAQEQKLALICRKLNLRPGTRMLDIGCGWGGLVVYSAEKYGADATGITLSQTQAELANQRIREAGVEDRARVLVKDYRTMDEIEEYDALVSVGMFEHVDADLLAAYFERAFQLLKPGGRFLIQGTARPPERPGQPRHFFSNVYARPDGELPIWHMLRAAEESGFEVRDVESLREHYALTLRQWVRRLEANHEQAAAYVDEPSYRVWRTFLSHSAYGFAKGRIHVYQSLLVKQDHDGQSGMPLNREAWYQA